jgi:hypothetical protein
MEIQYEIILKDYIGVADEITLKEEVIKRLTEYLENALENVYFNGFEVTSIEEINKP